MDTYGEHPLPGVIAGRFEPARLLGVGSRGEVLLAYDRSLSGATVALKLISASTESYERAERHVRKEIAVVRKLHSPHIVQLYEFGSTRDGGQLYLVFEYAEGGGLADRLRTGDGASDADKLRWLAEVGSGLAVAHSRGIVHRNIKPSNILFDQTGVAKISDFGFAALADAEFTVTRTAEIDLSPQYLAPEQLRGERATVQSDVYALSAVAYQLLAGRTPFAGDTFYSISVKQLCEEVDRAPLEACQISSDAREVILRGLSKNAAERPTAREFADVLGTVASVSRSPRRRLPPLRRRYYRAARLAITVWLPRTVAWVIISFLVGHLVTARLHERTAGATAAVLFGVEKSLGVSLKPLIRIYGGEISFFEPARVYELIDESGESGGARMQLGALARLGALVGVRDEAGDTPLLYAARYCRPSAFTPLMEVPGASAERDVFGEIALQIALKRNCRNASWLLMNAPLDAVDAEGNTLLHLAGKVQNSEAIGSIFNRFALPENQDATWILHHRNAEGFTPLHVLIGEGPEDISDTAINVLMNSGADPNETDPYGRSAIMLALEAGRGVAARSLFTWATDLYGRRSLVVPPSRLLNLSQEDARGRTLLMYLAKAASNPSMEPIFLHQALHFLLERDVPVDKVDNLGRTAFWYAAAAGDEKAVSLLAQFGAHCISDGDGVSPSDIAAKNRKYDLCAALDLHPPWSACTDSGLTPLLSSALRGDVVAVSALLDRRTSSGIECWPLVAPGCRNEPRKMDDRSYVLARKPDKPQLLESLAADLRSLVMGGSRDSILLLYLARTSSNPSLDGDALHRAMRYFLTQSASPDAMDKFGRTALWYAAAAGDEHGMSLLSQFGAHCLADFEGVSPADVAARNHKFEACAGFERHPRYSSCADSGLTPLLSSAVRGDLVAVSALLDRRTSTGLGCWPFVTEGCRRE